MDAKTVEKLRRDQLLRPLPDGREGIEVTVQFVGHVPAVPRPERKDWLGQRFEHVRQELPSTLGLRPDSLSVSGQSIEATVPVDELDTLRERLLREEMRVEVTRSVKVVGEQG